ncbi:hypothetical protein APU17_11460 [Enterobacter sp. 50858885]|nr:hypothetical protein APU17_11460 [Enterobacter sp. 50858885]
MKSVVIQQPNALEIEERPLPLPGAGDVRVKIKLAGILSASTLTTSTTCMSVMEPRSALFISYWMHVGLIIL